MKYEKIRRNLVFHLMEFSTRFLWRKNWANTSCADSLFELEPTAEGVAHFKDNLARSQTHNFYREFQNNGKSISDNVKSFLSDIWSNSETAYFAQIRTFASLWTKSERFLPRAQSLSQELWMISRSCLIYLNYFFVFSMVYDLMNFRWTFKYF